MPKRTKRIDPVLSGFPDRLRLARDAAGMGTRKLGELSGVGVGCVSRYENRQAFEGVSASNVAALARALGVRVGWLLAGEPPMRDDGHFAVVELTPQLVKILRDSTAQVQPASASGR